MVVQFQAFPAFSSTRGLPRGAERRAYAEASVNQPAEQVTVRRGPKVPPFGNTVDPREAGRKGGVASGVARRLRPLREPEAGIADSRNGAAKAKLLELKHREMADLERERRRANEVVCRLLDEADQERETIATLKAEAADARGALELLQDERSSFGGELAGLRKDEEQLRGRLETAEGLAAFLVDVPEGRLEAAPVMLGHEVVEEGEAGAAGQAA